MAAIIRSRIAPTPSGYLHIGNAFNFLLTESLTKHFDGLLRLRIDDLDAQRVRTEYREDIFETLSWLGIATDEGPKDEADHVAHYIQQTRLKKYAAMLAQLAATGKVYACTCSRADILRACAEDGQYPGTCRNKGLPLSAEGAAWRFRTDEGAIATWYDEICGAQAILLYPHVRDFIIRRRDGLPAYHVASLSDDVQYGINMIVRGEDLLYSTAAQLCLAEALELKEFLQCSFYHHPLINNEAGEKLSKSAGSDSLTAMRAAGVTSQSVRQQAADWFRSFG